ncbi:hypothetical protein FLAG1_04203 [Fusarium langsethiae]|uniref:Uncharacterized protein n=1 Tax=Fusarium langsethiae TaxID=179993 RepID=A0A0M9EZG0_FUSLA|nr:hypothetical protein FLAG1_04203 [Fusarium langsethiae]
MRIPSMLIGSPWPSLSPRISLQAVKIILKRGSQAVTRSDRPCFGIEFATFGVLSVTTSKLIRQTRRKVRLPNRLFSFAPPHVELELRHDDIRNM